MNLLCTLLDMGMLPERVDAPSVKAPVFFSWNLHLIFTPFPSLSLSFSLLSPIPYPLHTYPFACPLPYLIRTHLRFTIRQGRWQEEHADGG